MLKYQVSLLIMLIMVHTFSCSDLERMNPLDPGGNNYKGSGDGESSSGESDGESSSSGESEGESSSSESPECSEDYKQDEYFCDARDGKIYRYEKINNKIWMAENLNYYVEGSKCGSDEHNNNNFFEIASFMLKEHSEHCDMYGRLYDWETAKESCPQGWYIPTINDVNNINLPAMGGGIGVFNNQGPANIYIEEESNYFWLANEINSELLAAYCRNTGKIPQCYYNYNNEFDDLRVFEDYVLSVRCVKDN